MKLVRFALFVAFAAALAPHLAAAQSAPAPTDPTARVNMAALNEAVSELHNAQTQIVGLQAQMQVAREDLGALAPKAQHADELDAWVKAYFAPAPSPATSSSATPAPPSSAATVAPAK